MLVLSGVGNYEQWARKMQRALESNGFWNCIQTTSKAGHLDDYLTGAICPKQTESDFLNAVTRVQDNLINYTFEYQSNEPSPILQQAMAESNPKDREARLFMVDHVSEQLRRQLPNAKQRGAEMKAGELWDYFQDRYFFPIHDASKVKLRHHVKLLKYANFGAIETLQKEADHIYEIAMHLDRPEMVPSLMVELIRKLPDEFSPQREIVQEQILRKAVDYKYSFGVLRKHHAKVCIGRCEAFKSVVNAMQDESTKA